MSAYAAHVTCEGKTSKALGYFHAGSTFQQSQGQRALELITGKHGSVFSKYKAEAKDIISNWKKKRERSAEKSPELLFPSRPRARVPSAGSVPGTRQVTLTLELVQYGPRKALFLRKAPPNKAGFASKPVYMRQGRQPRACLRVNMQCSAGCNGATAICS